MSSTYVDGQGRTRCSPSVEHDYWRVSHMEHATNWCRLMWCPSRLLVERLRARGWNVQTKGLGEYVRSNADHVDVAAALDAGEWYRCLTHETEPIVGERPLGAAYERARLAGKTLRT